MEAPQQCPTLYEPMCMEEGMADNTRRALRQSECMYFEAVVLPILCSTRSPALPEPGLTASMPEK